MATATVTPNRTRKHVCTFDELSDRAKETARDWMRECQMGDFGEDEYVLEAAQTAAKILGIEFANQKTGKGFTPDIRWSGFSSQGDGASFVGTYSHAPQSPANIRKEFGTDAKLWAIADGLDGLQFGYKLLTGRRFTARITQDDNHYVHKYTMSVDLADDDDPDGDCEHLTIELETKVLNLIRDFAQWIYDGLEEEYEYRMSDESIEDAIRANEYQFNAATGKVV